MSKVYHAATQHVTQLPLFVLSKACAECHKEKSLEDFSPHPSGKFKKQSRCKVCQAAKVRAIRDARRAPKPVPRPGHRFCKQCERELPYPEEFVSGGQCKDCRAAYQRARRQTPEYRERDRDKHRANKEYYANYRIENIERFQAWGRAYREAHPEKQREKNLRRKAAKLRAVVETVDYNRILERDGYVCYICGKPIDPTVKSRTSASLTFDHFIPLQPREGEPQGSHTEDNLRPAHHCCNIRKSNTPFELLSSWQRRGPR